MKNSAQADIGKMIAGAVVIIIILIVTSFMLNSVTCMNEKTEINSLKGTINQKDIELKKAIEDMNFYKTQYEKLRDYNITKQDFVDIKAQINDLNYNYLLINNNLNTINTNISNNFIIYNLSLILNLALLPVTLFTLFDFTFLNFKYSNKIRSFFVTQYKSIIRIVKTKK